MRSNNTTTLGQSHHPVPQRYLFQANQPIYMQREFRKSQSTRRNTNKPTQVEEYMSAKPVLAAKPLPNRQYSQPRGATIDQQKRPLPNPPQSQFNSLPHLDSQSKLKPNNFTSHSVVINNEGIRKVISPSSKNYDTQNSSMVKQETIKAVYNTIQQPSQLMIGEPTTTKRQQRTINTVREDSNMRSRKRSQQPTMLGQTDRNGKGSTRQQQTSSRQRSQRLRKDLNITNGGPVEAYNTNSLSLHLHLVTRQSQPEKVAVPNQNISATLKQKLSSLIQNNSQVQSDRTLRQLNIIPVNLNQSAQQNPADSIVQKSLAKSKDSTGSQIKIDTSKIESLIKMQQRQQTQQKVFSESPNIQYAKLQRPEIIHNELRLTNRIQTTSQIPISPTRQDPTQQNFKRNLNRVVVQRGSEQIGALKKKLSKDSNVLPSSQHMQINQSMKTPIDFNLRMRADSTTTQDVVPIINRELFATVQYKEIYNQTLSAFQEDMLKMQQIETQRQQIGERIINHKKILQSLQPIPTDRRGSVALQKYEMDVSPKQSRVKKQTTIQNAYNQPISAARVYKRNQTTVRHRGPSNKRGAVIPKQFTEEDDRAHEQLVERQQVAAKTSRIVFGAQERNFTQKIASSSHVYSTDSNNPKQKNHNIKVYKSTLKNNLRDQSKRRNGSTERGSQRLHHPEMMINNSRDQLIATQSQDSCFNQPNTVITPLSSAIMYAGSIPLLNGKLLDMRQSSQLNQDRIQRGRLDTFKDEPIGEGGDDSQMDGNGGSIMCGQNMRYSQQVIDFKIVNTESEDAKRIINEDNPFESKSQVVANIKIKQSQNSPDKSIASKTTTAVDSSKNNSQALNFRKSRRLLTDNRQGGGNYNLVGAAGFRGSLQGNRRSYASNSQNNLVLTDQDSECKYNDNTLMLSMPMSIHRQSLTQAVIAEEAIDKEQDERTTTLKENESACQIFDESSQNNTNPNETPRMRYPHNTNKSCKQKSDDAGVLCDSMDISIPKHLDSPMISITTVQHSDDEVEARRGLEQCEGESEAGGNILVRKSTRSILKIDGPDVYVKATRNNNYLSDESAYSKNKPHSKRSVVLISEHSDDEMLLELDMDEFKINKL